MAVARIFFSILMAAQLAVAGLIIGLVASRLNRIQFGFDAAALKASVTDTCLMGTAANGVNLCYVAYGFSGVSVLATGALSLLQCCTCNACGLGFLLDTVFAAAGAGWWALAGVVLRYHTQQPAVLALPHAETRRWIVMLCWAGCAVFAAAFVLNLYRILARCCACCSGDGPSSSRRDVEAARGGGRGGGGHGPPRGGGWPASPSPPPTAYITTYAPAAGPPPGYPARWGGGKQGQFISG